MVKQQYEGRYKVPDNDEDRITEWCRRTERVPTNASKKTDFIGWLALEKERFLGHGVETEVREHPEAPHLVALYRV